MCNSSNYFTFIENNYKPEFVSIGDVKKVPVEGVGNIIFSVIIREKQNTAELKDFLYVPKVVRNFISEIRFRRAGLKVVFNSGNQQGKYISRTDFNMQIFK